MLRNREQFFLTHNQVVAFDSDVILSSIYNVSIFCYILFCHGHAPAVIDLGQLQTNVPLLFAFIVQL
ncbi:hypothetical protein T07_5790 [Trichinella nelsoni]|uniref:Uncharacterized protein n=1 Tax=Trichinella nelsoni TaxID=6336 RepID=A0A0V0RQ26_9BILA|nr:hypothetical protein T07_5790 [Trichinella nelsoni]